MLKRKARVGIIKLTVKYSVILVVILALLTAIIISSLFRIILTGLVLGYVFYPLYKVVYRWLRMRSTAAMLTTIVVFLLIAIPAVFVLNRLSTEVSVAFVVANQYLAGGGKAVQCEDSGGLCQLIPKNLKEANPKIRALLTNTLGKATEFTISKTSAAILALPGIVLNTFIIFFIMYYIFKDGAYFIERLKAGLPLKKHRQDAFIEQFNRVSQAVIFGTVIVAVLQAILAGLGFFIFGIPSPIIWAFVTLGVSLIPFLGPFVVWLPASLLLIGSGYYSGDHVILLRGIGLFLYGMLIVSGIDNFLKPRIIGKKANTHPALIFLAILGGVNFFGFVGVVVGPAIMAMLKSAFDTYVAERDQQRATE